MTNQGARSLMAAIMLQAVKDYEHLCNLLASGRIVFSGTSHTELTTKAKDRKCERLYYSFAEIERFIEEYGEICVEMDTNIILAKLRYKRRRAASKAQKGR